MTSWRKIEDENGFPFYLNENTNVKQWDHPKFSSLTQRIDDCNYVKHSKYRVALKFRVLQNALHMEQVPLAIIAGVFERHRLGNNESSLTLESCDLEAVLSDIYFASNKKNHTNTDVDFATELMLNFLYNVYDKERQGKIQVSSTKVLLGILSNCSLLDLYKFIFNLSADHNYCVTRLRLQTMLLRIIEVTTFLHEDACFGSHLINSSIEDCFSNSPGLVGITESNFIFWLKKGPQILSWIPLLHRIKMAEPVVHTVKCSTCKTSPLMGLRYRCIKCPRYTQCQRCFFTGRTNQSHKLSHSMREYCEVQGNSGDFSYTVIKKMCSLFCPRKLTDPNVSIVKTKSFSLSKDILNSSASSSHILCDIEPLSSPQTQLQVIIRQLETQNKDLQQILLLGGCSDKEMRRYLEEHRIHIAGQIKKLKILSDYLQAPCQDSPPQKVVANSFDMQSTPMVQNNCNGRYRRVGLELFSPIVQIPESSENNVEYELTPNGSKSVIPENSNVPYHMDDISTWIGGNPTTLKSDINLSPQKKSFRRRTPVKEFHNDLDDALAKLQQILANNFSLDDSLGPVDNTNLKHAVSEVEGMLTSIIDNVESGRTSSLQPPKV